MSLNSDPEIEQNNSYTLKVEWDGLDINFTHFDGKQNTDVFNTTQFYNFINGYYENDIRLIDVTINQKEYSKSFVNINAYIDYFNACQGNYSINFLAISFDKKQKLIIRTADLFLFPKFFENWKITPITSRTSLDYLSSLKYLVSCGFKGTNGWNLADYVFFTLVNKKIHTDNRFGFSHQPQFRQTIQEFKTKNQDFCDYMQLQFTSESLEEWDDFCYSMHNWFVKENEKNNTTITLFEEYLKLKKSLEGVKLFGIAYQDFEPQNELFVDLPFNLINRRLTINF